MPTNLTTSTIASTYSQILHVDGGPTATEKTVYGGTGVATALKVGTESASVENIRLNGNTISTLDVDGDLNLTPNGTGSVVISKTTITGGSITNITDIAIADGGTGASTAGGARTNLGLGTLATQNYDTVNITGGTIDGVTLTGVVSIEATTFETDDLAAGCNLSGNTLAADGTDADIDLNITPKGTGEAVITNINVVSGIVPFNVITDRAYASFYDAGTTDQTGSTTDRTAVKWATAAVTGAGITVASNTQITLAAAGTYRFNVSLQVNNTDTNDHDITVWFAKNGTEIANTGAVANVPKTGDGGKTLIAYEIFETVAANDYIEMYWYPENVAVTLHYVAAVAANPGVTPAIPAIPPAIVVVERIA